MALKDINKVAVPELWRRPLGFKKPKFVHFKNESKRQWWQEYIVA